MPINVTPTMIPDALIIEPQVFNDGRGYFFESFNQKDFSEVAGKKISFVQDNQSKSKKGVLRGLHYQTNQTQGKLVRVCRGCIFDVIVDMRQSSKTYGQWVGVELSEENKKQLWIPEGFAHGFLVLSDEADVMYKTTDYWDPTSEQCLSWKDETLNIQWPNIGIHPILNTKDSVGKTWDSTIKFK
jgi:dTDP-4-dehydrorhamnose 3,5-epimerase